MGDSTPTVTRDGCSSRVRPPPVLVGSFTVKHRHCSCSTRLPVISPFLQLHQSHKPFRRIFDSTLDFPLISGPSTLSLLAYKVVHLCRVRSRDDTLPRLILSDYPSVEVHRLSSVTPRLHLSFHSTPDLSEGHFRRVRDTVSVSPRTLLDSVVVVEEGLMRSRTPVPTSRPELGVTLSSVPVDREGGWRRKDQTHIVSDREAESTK